MRAIARNVQRHPEQLLPVAADEVLPRALVSPGTGARQRQFLQPQPGAEVGLLFRRNVGRTGGRIVRKILAQNFIEDGRELLRAHAVSRSPAALVQGRSDYCSVAGLGGPWHGTLASPR